MGPPPGTRFEYDKIPPPRSLQELPGYLRRVLGGFFGRLFYIFRLVWETGPWILFLMSAIAILQGLMPVVSAYLSRCIVNSLQAAYLSPSADPDAFLAFLPGEALRTVFGTNQSAAVLAGLAFSFLVFFFIQQILSHLVARVSHAVSRISGELVVRQVRLRIMEKAKTLDLASFDMPSFYEKLENANREAGNRPIQILSSTFSVISTLISLVSYVVILAAVPGMWWMAPAMVAVSIPSAIISFYYRRKNFNYMRRRSKDRRQMDYYADLTVNKDLAKEVHIFRLSDTFIDAYQSVFSRYYSGIRTLIWQENAWQMIIAAFSALVNCVFFAMIGYRVFAGEMMLGDYSLYTAALTSIATGVSSLISVSATVYEGTLFIDNLISFMNEKQTVLPVLSPECKEPRHPQSGKAHTIRFEHVSFTYPGTQRKVLDDINVTIRPGETLVLVGLNGAGKTTLLKLLTRLYDPTEGRILLDGHDLREYDVDELYRIFGIIFQGFGKYAFSVGDNIRFGQIDRPFTPEEVRVAAVQSNADDFISRLPQGYQTPLMRIFEQDGTDLSIGQWQKLAIARAFYSNSDILILDEPTASLDPIAEQEIFNQFDRLRADKTTIFVSHRLSSATVASKILVLEYGKVIEEGDHKTLMAKHGRYYELFSTQAKRYLPNDPDSKPDTGPEKIRPMRENV